MARVTTVALVKRGHRIKVEPGSPADKAARANGFKQAKGRSVFTAPVSDGETTDWLSMKWPALKSSVARLDGVEKAPKSKAEALAILRDRKLIPAEWGPRR